MRVTSVEETIIEVINLFNSEQQAEQEIAALIRRPNVMGDISGVDELRLDFNRIYSKKDILSRTRFGMFKFADSTAYKNDFPIQTILSVKAEERYLSAKFRNYMILRPRFRKDEVQEPYLFASLKNGYFYLLNAEEVASSNPIIASFKKSFSWIQKKISFRTSTK
jgi:hypothetical protein